MNLNTLQFSVPQTLLIINRSNYSYMITPSITPAVVSVSLPVAFGLWFMMYPVLVKVRWEDFTHLFRLRDTYRQMGFSLLANWVRSS